jgi:hypothetical protein
MNFFFYLFFARGISIETFSAFFLFCSGPDVPNPDEDPLPNEDNSENNSHDGQSHNDLVTINVTNEMGQTKAMGLSNGYENLLNLN